MKRQGSKRKFPVKSRILLWSFLQIRSLFWNDRILHWTDLDTDAAVYAGGKVNPVPVITLNVFAWTFVNASYRTGINAISNAFADISNNCMRHSVFSSDFFDTLVLIRFFLA
jgi:hypothetical protein